MKVLINEGDVYGRLTVAREVVPYISPNGWKIRKVLAVCQCGEVKEYLLSSLRSGATVSCGCYHRETRTTHGLGGTSLYKVWCSMRDRCHNSRCKAYQNYGGRGITVCLEWEDIASFIKWALDNGYQKGLEIDRIDNDKGYSPNNCRFVTRSVNSMNRRVKGEIPYRGICFHKPSNKYLAQVAVNGKSKYIGYYTTPEEAAKAYDEYVKDNNLPNQLNFN